MSSESWLSRKFHAISRQSIVTVHEPTSETKDEPIHGVKSIAHLIANSARVHSHSRARSPLSVLSHEERSSDPLDPIRAHSGSRVSNKAVRLLGEDEFAETTSHDAALSNNGANPDLKKSDTRTPINAIPAREPNDSPAQSISRPRPKLIPTRSTTTPSTHRHAYIETGLSSLISERDFECRNDKSGSASSSPHTTASTNQGWKLAISSPEGSSTSLFDLRLPTTNAASRVARSSNSTKDWSGRDSQYIQKSSIQDISPQAATHVLSAVSDYTHYNERKDSGDLGLNMGRKIWVKRPSASATLVNIKEDDLVDDVRDMILKKYANSLGRNFDSPDVSLRICPRETLRQERQLGPEEHMCQTLDSYYPGGQTVDEALVIDVPLRRTPKPSPRGPPAYYTDDMRPMEAGGDYFPPMPVLAQSPGPHLVPSLPVNVGSHHPALTQHAISVLTTGQVPPLPSPGGMRRGYTTQNTRPTPRRLHTSSPAIANNTTTNGMQLNPTQNTRSRAHSNASEQNTPTSHPPAPPPLPTPPVTETRTLTPPPTTRSSSPSAKRPKKPLKNKADHPSLPPGVLNGAVPPINVLIVEDNIINLKLLEAFMKRLKVRWQTAMDGRQAVNKWRAGGFHLVLMDIQLPVMSGLEATREIRRLETLNNIGVFNSSASSSAPEEKTQPDDEDKLPTDAIFKSPVIIVALTASSLQSDRHEALAAGCNDFLTKPVNFVWLERKVMEWGCMQALIDFDGWRRWKDFTKQAESELDKTKSAALAKKKKNRNSVGATGVTRINEEVTSVA